MRLGRKTTTDGEPAEELIAPAIPEAHATAGEPTTPHEVLQRSRRLQRVAEHFTTHGELLEQMRQQVEEETAPLRELLLRQHQASRRLMGNLEDRLRPLNEYADSEEANLEALEERLQGEQNDFVARSFATYIDGQRRRVTETRDQIERQRQPLVRFREDLQETVEVALGRFDDDMDQLERILAEQRQVMVRMLDGMRSESFTAVKEYLLSREATIEELADGGSADPSELGRALRGISMAPAPGVEPRQLQMVLDIATETDERLLAAAPPPARILPKPVPAPLPVLDAEEEVARELEKVGA